MINALRPVAWDELPDPDPPDGAPYRCQHCRCAYPLMAVHRGRDVMLCGGCLYTVRASYERRQMLLRYRLVERGLHS